MHGSEVADRESYYLALHPVLDQEAGNDNLQFTGGRYIDRFEQRDGEWKIAHRVCTIDWSRKYLLGEPWEGAASFPKIGAIGEDPSYHGFDFHP